MNTQYSQGTDVVTTFLKYEVVKGTRLKYLNRDLGWGLRERMQEDRARTGNKVMVRQATKQPTDVHRLVYSFHHDWFPFSARSEPQV